MYIADNRERSFEPWRLQYLKTWRMLQRDNRRAIFHRRLWLAATIFVLVGVLMALGAYMSAQYREAHPVDYTALDVVTYHVGDTVSITDAVRLARRYRQGGR